MTHAVKHMLKQRCFAPPRVVGHETLHIFVVFSMSLVAIYSVWNRPPMFAIGVCFLKTMDEVCLSLGVGNGTFATPPHPNPCLTP